ncbi:hypothetical protein [Variovorax sp. J31P207]|uniref:hypothetical protein n=1 Tax=Variovorax sp. J31P207 TaxID=3053510 RepID=UPI002574B3A6|nr:hypothetical protein [Variovorax sp. J31P207]MDM0067072.1 hypothetical protein [Variovorax sp. J31P207]
MLEAAYTPRAKFRNLVIGTHGYVTSPSVIERFQAEPKFKVMLPDGLLFHPKVYHRILEHIGALEPGPQ